MMPVDETETAGPKEYRFRSAAVLLTYQKVIGLAQGDMLVAYLREHLRAWRVRLWTAAVPELAGAQPYVDQIPLSRAIPLWGGISEGGFAVVTFHKKKKLTVTEWLDVVQSGKLNAAVHSLRPAGTQPWHVLCDNEKFLKAKASMKAYARGKLQMWFVPPRSPDLNPVEMFWAWLRRELRRRDMADLHNKRPGLGKTAYRQRVRLVCRSAKAQKVAKNIAKTLKKTCKIVVKKRGAHSGK